MGINFTVIYFRKYLIQDLLQAKPFFLIQEAIFYLRYKITVSVDRVLIFIGKYFTVAILQKVILYILFNFQR